MKFDAFLEILRSKTGMTPKRSGQGYSACCPAHDDTNPSLSVKEASDGKILLHCFAGCTLDAICRALSLEASDLFESDFTTQRNSIQTVYSYRDEQGKELYRKIRIEPGFDGKSKSFYSERIDDNGKIVRNLSDCRKVLYRLPEILKGIAEKASIFIVEGEKDADKLAGYGFIATTSSESLKWSEEFTETLKEADVVILYDMDETGIKRKNQLCSSLYGKTKRLRVIDLPGLEYQESHGADISDWLAMGHTTKELTDIVARSPEYTPLNKTKILVVTLDELLQMKLPKREMLLSPFLTTQGLCLLYAKRGVGKTHVALGIGYAVATGGTFLKWKAPQRKKVLYIDGEMPAISMQERLNRISISDERAEVSRDFLRLITPDVQSLPIPDLSSKEGQRLLEEPIGDCDLVILDNISCLFRGGVENDAESWLPVQEWALELRRKGKALLFVHHAGKSGQQRGTSKKEDILDTVILLKNPQGYRAEEGARFEVSFEKSRHFAGHEAASFEVQLREQEDDLWCWEINNPKQDPEVVQVAELTQKSYTIQQIMDETRLTKSQVTTRQDKARKAGLLP